MTKVQIIILAALAAAMVAIAMMLGNWAEQVNPDGIAAHPEALVESTASGNAAATSNNANTTENASLNEDTDGQDSVTAEGPRDAYSFGVSMGLLATGLFYCCIAFGLLIRARTKGQGANPFIYWVAGLAGLGFVLSYLVDDYFY